MLDNFHSAMNAFNDPDIAAVAETLQLAQDAILSDPNQLPAQFVGRLYEVMLSVSYLQLLSWFILSFVCCTRRYLYIRKNIFIIHNVLHADLTILLPIFYIKEPEFPFHSQFDTVLCIS